MPCSEEARRVVNRILILHDRLRDFSSRRESIFSFVFARSAIRTVYRAGSARPPPSLSGTEISEGSRCPGAARRFAKAHDSSVYHRARTGRSFVVCFARNSVSVSVRGRIPRQRLRGCSSRRAEWPGHRAVVHLPCRDDISAGRLRVSDAAFPPARFPLTWSTPHAVTCPRASAP